MLDMDKKKICSKCKEEKYIDEFHNNRTTSDGKMTYCAECNNEKSRTTRKEQKPLVSAYDRKANLKRNFGLTPEQYLELLEKQNNSCAICLRTPEEEGKNLAVDHDHTTGEIYGLLCWFCNHRFVGRKRNPILYERAAKFLSKGTGWFVPKKEKRVKKRKPY